MKAEGIAWVAEVIAASGEATGRFETHWESRPVPVVEWEEGPTFDDVEEAIAWARQRSDAVVVRVGIGDQRYSAGVRDPSGDEQLPPWTPRG